MRRLHLESTITIRRPPDDVFAFTIDMFNSPRVRSMTLASRVVTPGPLGIGSVAEQRVVILGFETHLRFTVMEWDPPHRVTASMSGPLLRSGRVRTEMTATSEGTRKVTTLDLELTNVGLLLRPLMGPMLRRDQARADRQQKELLEESLSDIVAG